MKINKILNYKELINFVSKCDKYKNAYKYYKFNKIQFDNNEVDSFITELSADTDSTSRKEIVKVLNSYNIFYTDNKTMFYFKFLFFKKVNGKLFIYINHFCRCFAKFIKLLLEIDIKFKIFDFGLSCFSFKFRPLISIKKAKEINLKINFFAPSQKSGFYEKALISYYLLSPNMLDPKCIKYKNFNFLDIYNEILEKSSHPYSICKAIFRGTENNNGRKKLFSLSHELLDIKKNNYVSFVDNLKYKYIIDIWGLNGLAARRYFLLLMNRVIFIPKEDANKQFFEIGENSIKPNIHYIEYSVNNIHEIITKIIFLENNPEEYEKIRSNCRDYALKNLNYEEVLKKIKIIINN